MIVESESIDAAYAQLTEGFVSYDYVDTFGGFGVDRPLREVWGTTDDGAEWRVHLLLTPVPDLTHRL